MVDPAIPQKSPYVMEMKAGDYYWCACGFSKTQPFCDGSHKTSGTGKTPVKVTLDKDCKVAWCGCKRSGNGARCDGTHKRLP
jgi:CDGSH-type Zn-finger protein